MIFYLCMMCDGEWGVGRIQAIGSEARANSEQQRTTQVRRAQVKFQRNKNPHPHPSTSTYLPQPSSLNLNLCLPRPKTQPKPKANQVNHTLQRATTKPPATSLGWERSTPTTSTSPLFSFLVSLEVVMSGSNTPSSHHTHPSMS